MKLILNERQYRRIFLNEVVSDEDTSVIDYIKGMTNKLTAEPSEFKFNTFGDVVSKWSVDSPFYGYHELPDLKDLPFFKEKSLSKLNSNESFGLQHPVIVVTDYGNNEITSKLKVYIYDQTNKEFVEKNLLFGAVTVSDLNSKEYCRKNKRMGELINACIDWKKDLVKVGVYDNTSGKKRKDGCDGKQSPKWLHGCGDHPYKSDAYLHPEAAQSFNKMNADYKNMFRKKGISINSAYRDVFHQGGVNSGGNPKAGSGTSNHGFGLSLDVGRGRNWMKKNGGHYGWCWFGAGDKPHFNYFPLLDKMGKNYTCVSKGKKRQQFKEGPPK